MSLGDNHRESRPEHGSTDTKFHSRITFYSPFWAPVTLCSVSLVSQDHNWGSLKTEKSTALLGTRINSAPRPEAHCVPLTPSAGTMSRDRRPRVPLSSPAGSSTGRPACWLFVALPLVLWLNKGGRDPEGKQSISLLLNY